MVKIISSYDVSFLENEVNTLIEQGFKIINSFSTEVNIVIILQKETEKTEKTEEKTSNN